MLEFGGGKFNFHSAVITGRQLVCDVQKNVCGWICCRRSQWELVDWLYACDLSCHCHYPISLIGCGGLLLGLHSALFLDDPDIAPPNVTRMLAQP